MINRLLLLTLAAVFAFTGVASAQTAPVGQGFNQQETHKEHRSDHNLRRVSKNIERQIDALEHDQNDYAGHRVAALNDLKQAREEIRAALMADKKH